MRIFLKISEQAQCSLAGPVEDDEMTFRRKLFYERNGFILNPWHHVQPAYHDDSVPVEMHIMSWPYVFSKEEYETFRADQAGIMP